MTHDWESLARAASLRLETPAPAGAAIVDAERALGSRLSASLRDLYAVCDGLTDEYGDAYVMRIDELTEQNQEFRASFGDVYMSFDDIVLFGQLGNGDMLFQPTVPQDNENVFTWDHEDDSRTWFAIDVADAIRRLAAGET